MFLFLIAFWFWTFDFLFSVSDVSAGLWLISWLGKSRWGWNWPFHSRRATWRWGRSRTIAIADELMVSSRRCEAAWKQHEKPRWRSDGTIQMHGFDMVWPTDLGHVIAHVTCVSIDSQASKIKNGWISLETPTDFEADFLTHRYVALETTHFQAW